MLARFFLRLKKLNWREKSIHIILPVCLGLGIDVYCVSCSFILLKIFLNMLFLWGLFFRSGQFECDEIWDSASGRNGTGTEHAYQTKLWLSGQTVFDGCSTYFFGDMKWIDPRDIYLLCNCRWAKIKSKKRGKRQSLIFKIWGNFIGDELKI